MANNIVTNEPTEVGLSGEGAAPTGNPILDLAGPDDARGQMEWDPIAEANRMLAEQGQAGQAAPAAAPAAAPNAAPATPTVDPNVAALQAQNQQLMQMLQNMQQGQQSQQQAPTVQGPEFNVNVPPELAVMLRDEDPVKVQQGLNHLASMGAQNGYNAVLSHLVPLFQQAMDQQRQELLTQMQATQGAAQQRQAIQTKFYGDNPHLQAPEYAPVVKGVAEQVFNDPQWAAQPTEAGLAEVARRVNSLLKVGPAQPQNPQAFQSVPGAQVTPPAPNQAPTPRAIPPREDIQAAIGRDVFGNGNFDSGIRPL